jgi:hypothetical protein
MLYPLVEVTVSEMKLFSLTRRLVGNNISKFPETVATVVLKGPG